MADAPLRPSLRCALRTLRHVEVGRGRPRQAIEREGTLHLRVDDPWMSGRHALLSRQGDRWQIVDADSKNGVLINGQLVPQATLQDGDIVELGRTLFTYREHPRAEGLPTITSTEQLEPVHPDFATFSPPLARRLVDVGRIAGSDVAILIRGPSGTGKEVLARAVHALSARARGPLVPVNCGGIAESLIQSELFGYRKGAFSGAEEDRAGLIRSADRGTLFLDEIGDMPSSAQAAVLRTIQEREVQPLGSARAIKVDTRVISATHRDLESMMAKGTFREDLFARLSGFVVQLPSLHERPEDLALIAQRLIRRLAPNPDRVAFHPDAARRMFEYDWPLNVRELEQALARAVVLAHDEPIDVEHLPRAPPTAAGPAPGSDEGVGEDERRARLIEALQRHRGNVSAIAREFDKDRKQIRRWLKRYELDADLYR
ncbi:MAG: sigma 54-interacting transcriptional regulator [Myxococcota bacterium]